MTFFSAVKEPRPVRLDEQTRAFAERSLSGLYGREAEQTPAVSLDGIPGFGEMAPYEQYDRAIWTIAEKAPLRLGEEELLCGAATLGLAIEHTVPATYRGQAVFPGVSHLTLGFSEALRLGVDDYQRRIDCRLAQGDLLHEQRTVLESMRSVIDALRIWHRRYLRKLDGRISRTEGGERARWQAMRDTLEPVPFQPPRSFYQAVQSLWFLFAFTRLCGTWPGIGRLDEMLGGYLEHDLRDGVISREEARRLLAHFFIKGCEWVRLRECSGGDAQHYQNIVLCGVDADGREVTNDVSRLTLEILEELPISDFPVAVRVNRNTPDDILALIARNVRHGGGVVAVYNEELILRSLIGFGYEPRDARRFANDGCWEIQIPGETCFGYWAYDLYRQFQEEVLGLDGRDTPVYDSFEELYDRYLRMLASFSEDFHCRADHQYRNLTPCSVVSLFTRGCIESGRAYWNRGAHFSVLSPHFGGFADTVNALYAVKKLVYDRRLLSFGDFQEILRDDWQGQDELLKEARESLVLFGNDSDEADSLAERVLADFTAAVHRVPNRKGVLRPAGVSTFGRQIEWKGDRYAHPHGFHRGDVLASNLGPTPGTDREGVTAVLRSCCRLPLEQLPCGTALDIKFSPTALEDGGAEEALPDLIRAFCELGGFFMQMDTADDRVLREAQAHPENYPHLAVRVAGWSARFATLGREWQDMIIERTAQQR
ncbi:MAG: hypothetical protein HFJ79_09860 [Clostridiales bacterium]|nr:hypothetical protein [Clostridiales bacterium]